MEVQLVINFLLAKAVSWAKISGSCHHVWCDKTWHTMTLRTVIQWCCGFRTGRMSITDSPQPGRPSSSKIQSVVGDPLGHYWLFLSGLGFFYLNWIFVCVVHWMLLLIIFYWWSSGRKTPSDNEWNILIPILSGDNASNKGMASDRGHLDLSKMVSTNWCTSVMFQCARGLCGKITLAMTIILSV